MIPKTSYPLRIVTCTSWKKLQETARKSTLGHLGTFFPNRYNNPHLATPQPAKEEPQQTKTEQNLTPAEQRQETSRLTPLNVVKHIINYESTLIRMSTLEKITDKHYNLWNRYNKSTQKLMKCYKMLHLQDFELFNVTIPHHHISCFVGGKVNKMSKKGPLTRPRRQLCTVTIKMNKRMSKNETK